MKTSITSVSTNSSSPGSHQLPHVQFNSINNFSPINSFHENTVHNQYGNDQNIALEYLAPQEIISNGNNPNLNILFNPTVSAPGFIPIQGSPINIQYTIPPQLNRTLNLPVPPPTNISYNNLNGVKMSRSKFTPQEDATLKELVAKYGSTKWSEIAMKLPNRTGRQCRERWKNYLAPGIQNGPWSPEEDALLSQKVKELGTMWSKMVTFFPGRTDVNLKNRWVTLRYKKGNSSINEDEDITISKQSDLNNNENPENDENQEDEGNNQTLLNNINNNSNNNIQVYPPNYVNYNHFYNYQNFQMNPPNYNNSFYNNSGPVEIRQPVLQMYPGESITIRQSLKLSSDKLFDSYTDIGTETDSSGFILNIANDIPSNSDHKRSNVQSNLEPSIILSQPRWLLNHKTTNVSFNDSTNEEQDNQKKKDLNESKIKLKPSSIQQNSQPQGRLEVPLLVALPLGTSS